MNPKFLYYMLLLLAGPFAYSQNTVTISGTVTDPREKPIKDASVHLLNTHIYTLTDERGDFHIGDIPPGAYTLSVTAVGYAAGSREINAGNGAGPEPTTANGTASAHLVIQLADAAGQLDAVIVTAEKKEENLQRVPFAISALNAKNVQEYGLQDLSALSAIIPNLYSNNPGDGRNVTAIRGIVSSSYDPSVTTYIDGVNQFTLDTYIPQLFDVASIEVLRGPQGTLYGRNAMGGVINILTQQPGNRTDAFAEASVGNYGAQRYTAGIRTPLIANRLFLGVSGLYEGMNGYYTNTFNNTRFDRQHRIGGNYYLKYLVNRQWALTLNVKHLYNRNDGAFPLAGSAADAFAHPFTVDQDAVAKLIDNTFNSALSVSYTGRHFNFSSQTSYQSNYRYYKTPIDGDFGPIDGITIINNYGPAWNKVKVTTQEFRFSSPAAAASPWKWTAGAYLFYQSAPNKQATHFGRDAAYVGSTDTNYAIINTTHASSEGAAVYGQATYSFNKKTDLGFGLRYDYQHSREEVLGEYQPDASPTPIFQTQPDTAGHVSFSAFSPMVRLAYHITDHTHLYAVYSRGYRTGGLTQLSSDPSQPPLYTYRPEYSDNFEIGAKNNLWKDRLLVNVALFYTLVSDAQIPTLILPDAITVTKNAGRLSSKGAELELNATPVKGLNAVFNFGYTHARYSTLNLSKNDTIVSMAGNHQIFTPDITSLVALQYSFPLTPSGCLKGIVRGEWLYLGNEYFDLANTIHQSPYALFNARVGLATRHFELTIWGKNLADKKYIAYAYDFGAVHLGNPRTYGATLGWRL